MKDILTPVLHFTKSIKKLAIRNDIVNGELKHYDKKKISRDILINNLIKINEFKNE